LPAAPVVVFAVVSVVTSMRCYRNDARLIDTAVWNFFTTYTEL
jgi:hypothetical protein